MNIKTMKYKLKRILISVLRLLPLIICLVFACIYLFSGKNVTAEELAGLAPEKPFMTAIFLISLYVLKSLTVFFPIAVLNVLGGFLFDPVKAIVFNCIGVVVELSIPYWIGRISGQPFAKRLEGKYPKVAKVFGEHSDNLFFLSVFLRALFCLPGDAISMYFGAIKMPHFKYLIGSFIGILPGTVAFTLLGMSITNPDSPLFWISILMTVGFAFVSMLCYMLWKNIKRNRSKK